MAAFALISERAIYLVVPLFGVARRVVHVPARRRSRATARRAGLRRWCSRSVRRFSTSSCSRWATSLRRRAGSARSSPRHDRRQVSAGGAGLLTALAIAIRPNLAPLAGLDRAAGHHGRGAAFAGIGLRRSPGHSRPASSPSAGSSTSATVRRLLPATAGSKTGLRSANVLPNLARYPRWLTETHTPFIWLSVLAPVWIARSRRQRGPARVDVRRPGACRLGRVPSLRVLPAAGVVLHALPAAGDRDHAALRLGRHALRCFVVFPQPVRLPVGRDCCSAMLIAASLQ